MTAHWLNTVLKKKKMVPPHRALHFPVAFPPGGKPCSQHVRRRLPAAGSPPAPSPGPSLASASESPARSSPSAAWSRSAPRLARRRPRSGSAFSVADVLPPGGHPGGVGQERGGLAEASTCRRVALTASGEGRGDTGEPRVWRLVLLPPDPPAP